jgi:XamI restriction endonuclease
LDVANVVYPFWTDEELEVRRQRSRKLYVQRYKTQVRVGFPEIERECRSEVEALCAATDDLRSLGDDPTLFAQHPELLTAARFVTRPAISADTLKIVSQEDGEVETICEFLDRDRFPWLAGKRGGSPRRADLDRAVMMTGRLMAEQRAQTRLRTELSRAQEQAVHNVLRRCGLQHVDRKDVRQRMIELGDDPKRGLTTTNYQELLGRGEFTQETALAGAKCDVPVRLQDGRLFPIECKVSNSEVNSTKRLIRETRGKHNEWRREFGGELMTGAVLAGAFSMINLRQAQQAGVLPFFEHDLRALSAFIKAGAHPRGG